MGIRKLWFSTILAIASLAYVAYGAFFLSPVFNTLRLGRQFRFSPIPTNGGVPELQAVGLLRDGCDLASSGGPASGANTSVGNDGVVILSLPEDVDINGWWFDLSAATASASGPMRLDMEVSPDGVSWGKVEYPLWTTRSGVTSAGSGRTEVDLRPPWQWMLRYSGCVVQGLLQVFAYGLGVIRTRGNGPARAATLSFVVMAAASAVAGAGTAAGGLRRGWRFGAFGSTIWFAQALFQCICSTAFIYEKWYVSQQQIMNSSPSRRDLHCAEVIAD